MHISIKKLWLEALRSGKYTQGLGKLRDTIIKEDGILYNHCCLGVLCDIHSTQTSVEWDVDDRYIDEETLLPSTVLVWSGLKTKGVRLPKHTKFDSLVFLNDEGATFAEIADVIEEHL